MSGKSTEKLEDILKNAYTFEAGKYLKENEESLLREDRPFCAYIKELIREKNLRQQDIFIQADIPERYGYKLLSGEKRTRQRDVILRICYAAELTLEETQHALMLYGMSPLYASGDARCGGAPAAQGQGDGRASAQEGDSALN